MVMANHRKSHIDYYCLLIAKEVNFMLIMDKGSPQKKTANFMTSCKKVGRWQTQNMISFLKEITTRGLVPESLVGKLKP